MDKKTNKQIEREEQIYQLSTLVAGEFSLQEVLDKLAEGGWGALTREDRELLDKASRQ